MEFWNSQLTEKSWSILQELKKKYKFILIGGWAIYLWAKQQKSQDIDIIVDIGELQKLKSESLSKNDRLMKYEIKKEEIDIDIYVPHFSKLEIPAEELKKHTKEVESFIVLSPEALLILKQGAYNDRMHSVKGEKDKIDIVSLLLFADIDFKNYKSILKKHSLIKFIEKLIILLRNFRDYSYLNLSPKEFKIKKNLILKKLRKI